MSIALNLQTIRNKIQQAEKKFQRQAGSVSLIAISKNQSINNINEAIAAGQMNFGENYIQEAVPKITALNNNKIIWHYTGRMQSNKAKYIAQHFTWAQSITKKEHAIKLNQYRPAELQPLNVCIEINLSNESTKTGINLKDIASLIQTIVALPRLKLRGLMAIPAPVQEFALQLATFEKLTQLYQQLNESGLGITLDTLSMGMSDDFEAAIAAGATMVRIGTAIFGPRSHFHATQQKNLNQNLRT